MPVKIKVDEDLPKGIVDLLKDKGYLEESVHAEGMSGWKDDALWRTVQNEGRFLVTADKGFADIRTYPAGTHRGILLLRPDQDGIRPMLE